jgi:hypothetical protein
MQSLDWKDASEPAKTSTATPWFGATVLLIGVIVGFIAGKLFL